MRLKSPSLGYQRQMSLVLARYLKILLTTIGCDSLAALWNLPQRHKLNITSGVLAIK